MCIIERKIWWLLKHFLHRKWNLFLLFACSFFFSSLSFFCYFWSRFCKDSYWFIRQYFFLKTSIKRKQFQIFIEQPLNFLILQCCLKSFIGRITYFLKSNIFQIQQSKIYIKKTRDFWNVIFWNLIHIFDHPHTHCLQSITFG